MLRCEIYIQSAQMRKKIVQICRIDHFSWRYPSFPSAAQSQGELCWRILVHLQFHTLPGIIVFTIPYRYDSVREFHSFSLTFVEVRIFVISSKHAAGAIARGSLVYLYYSV